MSEGYQYLDDESIYIDQKTGVLKNLHNIQDLSDLLFFESVAVASRIQELYINPILVESTKDLFRIHQHLFQDVYSWAGHSRVVEISKDNKQFFPTSSFKMAMQYIDALVNGFQELNNRDKGQIAESLANILDHVNYFHPFREGNGRAQREFIRLLALQKGYTLNLNPLDDKDVYLQYMTGTINSDVDILTRLIENQLIEISI